MGDAAVDNRVNSQTRDWNKERNPIKRRARQKDRRGQGGGVAVADGNTNVGERRSAVNRRRVACEDARIDKER